MKIFFTVLFMATMFHNLFCQNMIDFAKPLDIPPALSGSFGEIRTDRFHTGIDFRTQGVTRHNVFSIEEGFVSRIRIQTGGYGKALYIDHPEGYTSVYGHLEEFNESIDLFVKNFQYLRKNHSVEIFPEKGRLTVSKGELIALSGNTGSSGGPHLHFEIRKTNGQMPLNVLQLNSFGVADNILPVLYTLAIYPLDSMSQVNGGNSPVYIPLERTANGKYKLQGNNRVRVSGKAGFGIEAFDYPNGSSLRCGINSLELSIMGKPIYHFEVDKFDFAETRYLNAHVDYPRLKTHNKRIHLLYKKPGNRLSLYKTVVNDGAIQVSAVDRIEARISVKDAAGNESLLAFLVEGVEFNPISKFQVPEHVAVFGWRRVNRYKGTYSELTVPQGALYDDIYFKYSMNEIKNNIYPYVHFVHDSLAPLHLTSSLRIKADVIPEHLKEKTVMIRIIGNGQKTSIGGKWEGDWLVAGISSFGRFTLDVDTLPPIIKPANISPGKNMTGIKEIRFTIDDNLTGISEYNGFINNQWVLFEYDPKNKLLFYTFDKSRLQSGLNHELEVYLTDGVGNKTMFHTSFTW